MSKKRDKRKEKFSVHKYFKGYTDFQNHLKNIESVEKQLDFNTFLSNVKQFAYILYTNRRLEKELSCLVDASQNIFFNLLNTSKSTFYGFRKENFNLDQNFLKNLYLFPNQINFEGVFNLIKAEIRKLFKSHTFERVNFDDVTKKYLEIIKLWTKGCEFEKETKYITLSKRDVINILSDILLESYKCDFEENQFSHYDCPQKNIWNKLMLHKDISIVYGDDITNKFLKDYIGTEVKLNTKKQGRYWKTEVARWASNVFCESVSESQIQIMKICGNNINDCITMASIYKFMWFYKNLPLLLEINSEEEYKDIIKILRLSDFKLKVILVVPDQDFVCRKSSKVNHFSSLEDLEPSNKLNILNLSVQFQGRISLPLAEITKADNMLKYLKCADIIYILCNKFNVGNKVDFNCKGYIDRSVLKTLIDLEALVKIKNDFFLVEVQNIEESEKILTKELVSFGFSINNHSNICLLESDSISQKFDELKMTHDCIHRLLFHEDCFEWKESTGSVKNISAFQIYDEYSNFYDDVLNFVSTVNKFQIISACPGMGKSVLLDYISCFANTSSWILPITLRTIAENCEMEDDQSEFFTYYMDELLSEDSSVQNMEFSSMVFKDMLKTKKVLVLLDGFDEISILYKNKFSNLIEYLHEEQYPVIITTRENMTDFLKTTFNVLSKNLKPLTLDEQKQFLTNFFKTNIKIKNESSNVILLDFVEELLIAAKHNLSDRDGEFTGIPLQLNLLANNFLKECKMSISLKRVCLTTKFDLLDLYDKFIKNKTSILCEKFGASEKQWLKSLENNQHLFALQYLFKDYYIKELNIGNCLQTYYENEEYISQLMQKEGILIARPVKDKINIDFVHRTFAEYLAAQWLTKNVKNEKFKVTLNLLSQVRFVGYHKFLFVVFDRMLAKTCPFHLDIINVKVDDIKTKLELNPKIFVETDEINRTAFHMFGLYADDYTEEDLIEIFNTEKLKNLNIDLLDNLTSFSPLDYALLLDFWTYANIICELSPYMRLQSYDTSFTGVRKQFLKYKYVFFTVFHNYLCRELLLGKLCEEIQIFDYTEELCKRIGLPRDILKFVEGVCTVGEYLKICGIKDATNYYYYDVRFAVAFGSKKNVEDLLSTKELNINFSCNIHTLLYYATIYNRSDIIAMLLNTKVDVNKPGKDKFAVVHGGFDKILGIYFNKNGDLSTPDGSRITSLDIALDLEKGNVALTLLKHNVEITNFYQYTLHDIVELGNAELLQEFLKKDFDINLKLINNVTPLHTALKNYRIDLAKILISNNCDIKSDNAPNSLIHLAAKTGNLELLNLFLNSGLNINKKNDFGKTPLMIAIENGHVEFANFLIFNKADVSAGGVFFTAILKGNEEIVGRLIEAGCDVNSRDDYGNTPLLTALEEDKLNIAKLLLQQNPDINVQNDFGFTTLHYAAMHGHQDLVDQFLDCGVDINQTTNNSDTALLLALKNRFIEVAKLLLFKMAKVDVVNKEMCSSLHYAAESGDMILVQDLIAAGAELNLKNNCGCTPLHLAICNNKPDVAKLLLSYDLDIPLKLHVAAAGGNDEIIILCLEKGMEINEQDFRGMTPIYCAFQQKQFKTAKLLIDNGADMTIIACSSHDSGLHYAARIGYDDLVKAFLNKGFDINEKNLSGDPPLIIALLGGNLSSAKLLHSEGAEIDIKRVDRSTTLHMAALCGYTELIMDCIGKGHDINSVNFDCNLPIDFALMENKFEAAKLLIENGTIPTMLTWSLYVDIDVRSEFEVDEKVKYFKLLLNNFGNINLKDKDGNTILHYICYSDYIKSEDDQFICGKKFYREAVKFLVHLGADFVTKNKNCQSAYGWAVERNLKDILMIFD